jgi:hypothetical protein
MLESQIVVSKTTARLLWVTVVGPSILTVATLFLLALGVENRNVLYISLLSGWPFALVAAPFIISRPTIKGTNIGRDSKLAIRIALFATLYFAVWALAGLAAGQHPKDVVGSTLRVVSPYASLLVCMWILSRMTPEKVPEAIWRVFWQLILVATLGATGKLFLVSRGNWDAWGLGGFAAPTFFVAFLILSLVFRFRIPVGRVVLMLLGMIILTATLASLKRSAWVTLLLTPVFMVMVARPVTTIRIGAAVAAALVSLFVIAEATAIGSRITERVMYTFEARTETEIFDNSSTGRIHEVRSALGTLRRQNYPVSFITGLGPGAGYENLTGWRFRNFNEAGEPYDIHSGWFLQMFRSGMIGVALSALLIWQGLRLASGLRGLRRIQSKGIDYHHLCGIVAVSAGVHLVIMAPAMLASSGLVGNWEAGAVLAIGLRARDAAGMRRL